MLFKTISPGKFFFCNPFINLQSVWCVQNRHPSFHINTALSLYKQNSRCSSSLTQHSVPLHFPRNTLSIACNTLGCSARSSSTMSPTAQFIRPSAPSPTLRGTRPITVCVEGNIGSGKTTLLNHLAAREGVEVFQEPVTKWRNVRGKNLLDLMYQDPSRWSHLFQTYVQLTMLQLHMKPSNARVKVLERSIHSARHCFVENLYRTGKMSQPEYNVYCEWYNMITNNLDVSVDLIVYLSAEPEVVQERIVRRGRTEEASIPLAYLSQLHDLHQGWLREDALPAPLLVLHKDMTLQQMCSSIEEHLDIILCEREPPSSTGGAGSAVGGSGAAPSPRTPLLAAPLSPAPLPETAAAIN